jgi:hypothetical protein
MNVLKVTQLCHWRDISLALYPKKPWKRRSKNGYRYFLKRQMARSMRRAAKQDPENAPIKPRFFSWEI